MRINVVSRFWCCETQQMETMSHLFLTAPVAQKLWRFFVSIAEVQMDDRNLMQNCKYWWYTEGNSRLQYYLEEYQQ